MAGGLTDVQATLDLHPLQTEHLEVLDLELHYEERAVHDWKEEEHELRDYSSGICG